MGRFDITKIRKLREMVSSFNRLGYTTGAEIGVLRGDFSQMVLDRWGGKLFLVDAWRHFDSGYEDGDNFEQARQDENHDFVVRRFAERNVKIIREESVVASSRFGDGELDWVFIDANHCYEAVKADLYAWWGRVRPGGMVAGHDYLDKHDERGEFGVKRAVDEFLAGKGLGLPHVTLGYPSWMILKPGGSI